MSFVCVCEPDSELIICQPSNLSAAAAAPVECVHHSNSIHNNSSCHVDIVGADRRQNLSNNNNNNNNSRCVSQIIQQSPE